MRAWPVLMLLTGACVGATDTAERRGPPPGLLWVTLEGVRPDAEGLDVLHACGTRYVRAYTPTPQLQPNLATLFTGQLPAAHGLWTEGHHRLADGAPTVAAAATGAGWQTTSSTGTLRTDRRSGLHGGFARVHDQPDPAQAHHAAEALVQRVSWSPDPELVWVHLRADDLPVLPSLLAAFDLAHPEGVVVAVGIEGVGDGLTLGDDGLHVPLVVCGADHAAGDIDDQVVGLPSVTAEVRLRLGLPLEGTLPLGVPGPEQVVHEARAGQLALGAQPVHGITLATGRLVRDGERDTWFPVSSGRITGYGQPASKGSDAHRRLEAAAVDPGESPRRFPPPADLLALATETPWVLGDPDQPVGRRAIGRLKGAARALHDGSLQLARRRLGPAVEATREPALADAPAGAWLRVLAHRQAGRATEAVKTLDDGPLADTPFSRLSTAWVALEGFDRMGAVQRAVAVRADHPEHPTLALHAATVVALATLQPWTVGHDDDAAATEARREAARAQASEWLASLGPRLPPRGEATALLLDPHPSRAAAFAPEERGDPVVRLAAAVAAWHAGEAARGHESLRALVRDEPTDAVARALLARWDLELGHDGEAVRLLSTLARRHPDDPLVQAWFAEAQAAYTPEERHERQVDRAFQRP